MEVDKSWYKPKIDKKVLKELSKRSDWPGIKHVIIFFSSLFISSFLAYYTWGTWWTIFWFWVYGTIYVSSNPIWHEAGHRTAFKSKVLNEIFYQIGSFMTNFEPIRWRWMTKGKTFSN